MTPRTSVPRSTILYGQGATKVAVMGASLGAVTAFVAAGRYPDKVTGVVGLSIFERKFHRITRNSTRDRRPTPPRSSPLHPALPLRDGQ